MFGSYELNSSLNMFTSRCDELISAGYILADKKISNLLKCIVTNGEIVELMEECLTDFNYEVEFLKARSQCQITGNSNRFRLNLPAEKKKFVAFVLCMLSEFDSGTKDLHRFLLDYYFVDDGSMFSCYNEFCQSVIKPFKRYVEVLIRDMDDDVDRSEASERAEKYFSAEPLELTSAMIEELMLVIQELTQKIASEASLNLTKKQEMMSITEGLSNAIITKDARLIKILWIGFKNTFKQVKAAQKVLNTLEEKLTSYWII